MGNHNKRENLRTRSIAVTASKATHTDTMSFETFGNYTDGNFTDSYYTDGNYTDYNDTDGNYTDFGSIDPEAINDEPSVVEMYIWIIGIVLSTLCLLLQVVLFIIRPKLRKIDQKILTQLTVARLLNSILEFMLTYSLFNFYTKDVTFALYLQTDIVLVCWMFVYTKNLYDKVVLVFALQKCNFLALSIMIWVLTIPLGVLCPVFLQLNHFTEFYQTYSWLKFIILTLNVLFFGRIFYVIMTRSRNTQRNYADIIKTCIISFLLVCLTSLQVFVNDILAYLEVTEATNTYCLINSFQAIAATIIFLILARNNI